MGDITVDVWLYGALARYGGDADQGSYANLAVRLPAGSTVADLLAHLHLPTGERGFSFISGNISALPGVQPDLGHILVDGDRIGLFDPKSMWPFQYRHGAAMIDEMARALDDWGLRPPEQPAP
ncbi:MAG TPA: MoaD/ThiS family protein [Anaerolineae bacterium]|nr:MoaD/ThiS family protein [Anaerolineae bacterium]HOQ99209.1 MoaD/ThiS family protein [Anaerolineae bacterium]HPL28287.1 MoaD/ThiS family protein [Anaerolineae bacterium]